MGNSWLQAILLVTPLVFSPCAFSAAGAPPPQQGVAGHAPHVSPAGNAAGDAVSKTGETAGSPAHDAAGRSGMTGGAARAVSWTAYPLLKARAGGEGRDRRVVTVVPQGLMAGSIDAYSNDLQDVRGRRQFPLEMAGARLDKPASGGFHWLAAREERDSKVLVASTVHFFSDPGKNPTAMFMQQKHELEIIPQPFPREHSRYRANEDWKFLVRFNGKPLAGQKIKLETANGSRVELVSDPQGIATLHVPDDFASEAAQKAAGAHNHGRRSADFVLATEHVEAGKAYLTAFNASYGPDAFDKRSLALGLGFTLLGMMGAAPLLRNRKDAGKSAATSEKESA